MSEHKGQRGKLAEKAVEKLLKKWNGRAGFAYWRLPDARSARSFLSAQPGDFAYFCNQRGGIIEVKSTEHAYRLPRARVPQLPTLNVLALAGAQSIVLIHHSQLKVWRYVIPEKLQAEVPSWDLRGYPTYTSAEEALMATGWFSTVQQ